jgi:hypothetical protein
MASRCLSFPMIGESQVFLYLSLSLYTVHYFSFYFISHFHFLAGLPFVTDLLQTKPVFCLKFDFGGRPQKEDDQVFSRKKLVSISALAAIRWIGYEVRSKSMSGYVLQ